MTAPFWSSRAVRAAALQTVLWTLYACVPALFPRDLMHTDTAIDAGLIFVLGLFMAVRINRAYERWWEARTLWGKLVNVSRNLAVKVRTLAQPTAAEARIVHRLVSAFAFGLRDHLRGGAKLSRLEGFEEDDADPDHVPSELVVRLYEFGRAWTREGRISGHEERILDAEARWFLEVAGACERIKNTPLPPSLTLVTRVGIALLLIGMPWVLREEFGWWIVPAAGAVTFLVLVAETIASTLEHPFGTELNQLNLTNISHAIEQSTGEILGVDGPTPSREG